MLTARTTWLLLSPTYSVAPSVDSASADGLLNRACHPGPSRYPPPPVPTELSGEGTPPPARVRTVQASALGGVAQAARLPRPGAAVLLEPGGQAMGAPAPLSVYEGQ